MWETCCCCCNNTLHINTWSWGEEEGGGNETCCRSRSLAACPAPVPQDGGVSWENVMFHSSSNHPVKQLSQVAWNQSEICQQTNTFRNYSKIDAVRISSLKLLGMHNIQFYNWKKKSSHAICGAWLRDLEIVTSISNYTAQNMINVLQGQWLDWNCLGCRLLLCQSSWFLVSERRSKQKPSEWLAGNAAKSPFRTLKGDKWFIRINAFAETNINHQRWVMSK